MMMGHDQLILAEQVEILAGELYRLLDGTVPAASEARPVFARLALEEDEHARRIVMLRGMYARNPSHFEDLELPTTRLLRELLAEGEALRRLLAREGTSLELAEARRLMIELERHFAEAHAHVLLTARQGELRDFFAELARQDRAHVQILEALVVEPARGAEQ